MVRVGKDIGRVIGELLEASNAFCIKPKRGYGMCINEEAYSEVYEYSPYQVLQWGTPSILCGFEKSEAPFAPHPSAYSRGYLPQIFLRFS